MSYTPKIEDIKLMAKEAGVEVYDREGELYLTRTPVEHPNICGAIWQPHLKLDHLKLVWEAMMKKRGFLSDGTGMNVVVFLSFLMRFHKTGNMIYTFDDLFLATLKFLKEKSE